MITHEATVNRLYNWKFGQALRHAQGRSWLTPRDQALIEALSTAYGNVGWFEGNHGVIVAAAVETLIGKDYGTK